MGLFGGNDDEDDIQEVDPPEADLSQDGTGGSSNEEPSPEASDRGNEDGQEESTPTASENDLDVEEALKELSARMAVLSSNLEGVQESRGELEDKLGNVEERMSRLGSLAEAVSSEYNPFISENAPDQPSWTPDMEEGDDLGAEPPGTAPPSSAQEQEGEDGEAPDLDGDLAKETTNPDEEKTGDEPHGDVTADSITERLDEIARMPRTDPERLETAPTEPIEDVDPEPAYENPFGENRELEENLLLLEWVGMMLDRVGRAGLLDLLDYYRNLGWLDKETKERATRVAVGVDAPDRVEQDHWRGDVDLHRQSLVAIQRLQGKEVPAARIDELQLDLKRLFEG